MALRDAIRALSETWADVQRRLCPEDGRLVIEVTRSLTEDPDDEDLMLELLAHLAQVLPPDHPILTAIAIEDTRSTTTPRVWAEVIEQLRRIVASPTW
jgi:hypothetical protein